MQPYLESLFAGVLRCVYYCYLALLAQLESRVYEKRWV